MSSVIYAQMLLKSVNGNADDTKPIVVVDTPGSLVHLFLKRCYADSLEYVFQYPISRVLEHMSGVCGALLTAWSPLYGDDEFYVLCGDNIYPSFDAMHLPTERGAVCRSVSVDEACDLVTWEPTKWQRGLGSREGSHSSEYLALTTPWMLTSVDFQMLTHGLSSGTLMYDSVVEWFNLMQMRPYVVKRGEWRDMGRSSSAIAYWELTDEQT